MEFDNLFYNLIFIITSFTIIIILTLLLVITYRYFGSISKKNSQKHRDSRLSIGFFHPYCNAGGGGERVLWCGIKNLQLKFPNNRYIVYTGDIDANPDEILRNVKSRFNINLDSKSIEFIYLSQREWVEAYHYPHLTLLCQSLGSIILGFEALRKFVPDIYIDTMGYAFTLPIFKLIGRSKVGAYVHYPTISTDMLERVSNQTQAHNNNPIVAGSRIFTSLKLIYYRLFAWAYSKGGKYSDLILVNSSWTQNHIQSLWQSPSKTFKIFPPCDVSEFEKIPLEAHRDGKIISILSIGQFRPEKDHLLQIKAFGELRNLVPNEEFNKMRLVLVGSVRNIEDKCRVANLNYICAQMELENHVEFKINVSFSELVKNMEEGLIGIHTMWNEHFGIGIVECMAAGLIMVAHKSGGPMMDIVETIESQRTGFLATSEKEYAETILQIIQMSPQQRNEIRKRARSSVQRFSDEKFSTDFINILEKTFDLKQ